MVREPGIYDPLDGERGIFRHSSPMVREAFCDLWNDRPVSARRRAQIKRIIDWEKQKSEHHDLRRRFSAWEERTRDVPSP